MKWVLILTLTGLWDTGPAITSIANFYSREECIAAGNEWLNQLRRARDDRSRTSAYAVCVQQGARQ